MIDLKSYALAQLAHLPACTAPSFSREEKPLPLIVLSDDSIRVAAQADGRDYLEEYVLAADVYAADQLALERLCQDAHLSLSRAGFRLTACQDLYDEQAYCYRRHMRYRALVQGDIIYQ
ncbi:MAG: hypothetical protein E7324_04725 [Clostridiales bacterium]|nr:hypothetical protein [Clostridiales bacterium]